MSVLRVGLLGAGQIAGSHAALIDQTEDAALVAVCDVDPGRAEHLARRYGAAAYGDLHQLLEGERLDALWVCTPPFHHRDPVEAALAAGLHVYLEKPIARTVEDGEAIVAASAAAGTVCGVGYQWHASDLLAPAREALGGRRPSLMVGRNFGSATSRPWFLDPASGGGQILERGSHHIDLQRALAGEVASVRATAGRLPLAGVEGSAIDDAIAMQLAFAGGALGTVHIAWTGQGQPKTYGVDVLADGVTLYLELGPRRYRLSGSADGGRVTVSGSDPAALSVRRFLDAAAAGDPSRFPCTPADALETLRVAVACERSMETGVDQPV
jgi:predicted dehydrogenase